MSNSVMNRWVRIAVFTCGALLLITLVLPLWRIELDAPQYPEGLVLKIYPHKLGGDVEIVNGLNHYIGMKTLHAEEFIEFTILPYLIGFFALSCIVVGFFNRRVLLYILTGLFMTFALLSIADFWRWEYDYGHNLDPNAAIQVPGMSYQPPLLGYKQLLNFGAFSIPASGGWIFFSVGVILVAASITQAVLIRKAKLNMVVWMLLATLGFVSCSNNPDPIKVGRDNCSFCKMTVADNRFGAEIVTDKGKVYKFDDLKCLLDFIEAENQTLKEPEFYLTDFGGSHQLLKATECLLLKSNDLKTPMNGNITAFSSHMDLQQAIEKYSGEKITWSDLIK